MIQISQLKLPVGHTEEELRRKIARELRCPDVPFTYEILRKSLDARHKTAKLFVYTVIVKTADEKKVLRKAAGRNIEPYEKAAYVFPQPGTQSLPCRPVIVGSGPAGLFCAWYLAKAGYRPIVLERGEKAGERAKTVARFWEEGILDPESNVQFGEGGAGTFSDGKLNTLVKDPAGRNREVLLRFVAAGAPGEILYEQKPHLGTDLLVRIVTNLREEIERMGGECLFRTRMDRIEIRNGQVEGLRLSDGRFLAAQVLVLAPGHSARDTFAMLEEAGLRMEPKSFAVGLRVEHPQKRINLSLYGEEENRFLGAAAYKVTHTCADGRGVYSFCMCPGGYVVNASSEPGRLCVNGMSYHGREGINANSAIIVTVTPQDFPGSGPLGGIAFQRSLEEAAYQAAGGKIPVQRWEDYQAGRESRRFGSLLPKTKGAAALADVRRILPEEIAKCICEGMAAFGKKIEGFDDPDTLLSAVESRTSAPLRILRDPVTLMANIQGIYPCGEGAGYAGGITSAAMDGIRVAEAVARRYRVSGG